ADDRIRADAEAGRTGVSLRAGIAVAARGPLRLRRWLTLSRCLVARAIVALIREGGAVTGGATAHASAAAVGHGAEETIIAGRTVGLARVGAAAGRRGAAAGRGSAGGRIVALAEGGADDGVRADAGAGLAGVGLGAGVSVRAVAAVRLGRVGAAAARGMAGARDVALIEGGADDGVRPD